MKGVADQRAICVRHGGGGRYGQFGCSQLFEPMKRVSGPSQSFLGPSKILVQKFREFEQFFFEEFGLRP